MCKNTNCFFATVEGGEVLFCSFYMKGKNLLPENCYVPHLRDEEDILIEEVK